MKAVKVRSTVKRVAEIKRWLKKNRQATSKEFIQETGGTASQYYHFRHEMGITQKNPLLSESMKKVAEAKRLSGEYKPKRKPKVEAPVVEAVQKPKEEVIVEGNTPDFIWYEIDLLQRKLGDISNRLAHVMKVSQTRDADQKKMMRDLINENTELRVNNSSLTLQVAELTEMINGTPV